MGPGPRKKKGDTSQEEKLIKKTAPTKGVERRKRGENVCPPMKRHKDTVG